jgi:hypothetical protein
MAGTALSFDDRLVSAGNRGEIFPRIGPVATGAQKSLLLGQHTRYIAAMGVMAAIALPGSKRRVGHAGLRYLHQLLVAGRTKGRVLCIDFQQIAPPGPVGLMTVVAKPAAHRLMGAGLGKFDFGVDVAAVTDGIQTIFDHTVEVGAVRIVATAAGTFRERLMGNRHLDSGTNIGVAGKTERLLFVNQQFGLRCRMVSMAGQTSPFFVDGFMGRFCFGLQWPVALVTKRIAGSRKQHPVFRCVGPVA